MINRERETRKAIICITEVMRELGININNHSLIDEKVDEWLIKKANFINLDAEENS